MHFRKYTKTSKYVIELKLMEVIHNLHKAAFHL